MPQHTVEERKKGRKTAKSKTPKGGIVNISCNSGKCLFTGTSKKNGVITAAEINSTKKRQVVKTTRIV